MKGATQIATKKIELDEYKPGSAIAKFISKNFKFAKQQNKSVLAPKLIYIPKKTMDEKVMKSGREEKLISLAFSQTPQSLVRYFEPIFFSM